MPPLPEAPPNPASMSAAGASSPVIPTHLDLAIYLHYTMAGASYCSNASLTAWNCTPCRRSRTTIDELTVYEDSGTDARAFTAAVTPQPEIAEGNSTQHADGRRVRLVDPFLVLSWRGTETLENWLQNCLLYTSDAADE